MEAHAGERARPVASGASLLEFEVVQRSTASWLLSLDRRAGPRRRADRRRRRAAGVRRRGDGRRLRAARLPRPGGLLAGLPAVPGAGAAVRGDRRPGALRRRPGAGLGLLRPPARAVPAHRAARRASASCWSGRSAWPTRVFTSNVDGQFQRAGFAEEQVAECHGSIHFLQCMVDCGQPVWSADDVDRRRRRGDDARPAPLPSCPACGALARPNILMFGDVGVDRRPHRRPDAGAQHAGCASCAPRGCDSRSWSWARVPPLPTVRREAERGRAASGCAGPDQPPGAGGAARPRRRHRRPRSRGAGSAAGAPGRSLGYRRFKEVEAPGLSTLRRSAAVGYRLALALGVVRLPAGFTNTVAPSTGRSSSRTR